MLLTLQIELPTNTAKSVINTMSSSDPATNSSPSRNAPQPGTPIHDTILRVSGHILDWTLYAQEIRVGIQACRHGIAKTQVTTTEHGATQTDIDVIWANAIQKEINMTAASLAKLSGPSTPLRAIVKEREAAASVPGLGETLKALHGEKIQKDKELHQEVKKLPRGVWSRIKTREGLILNGFTLEDLNLVSAGGSL